MKRSRILSLVLALVLVFSLASVTAVPAKAVQTFDIWVLDTQVTAANQNDVLGDGTVSYDPDTNTLTLKNAKIENLDENVGYGDGIWFEQELTITGTGSITGLIEGIDAYAPLTIRDAKLTIHGVNSDAIYVDHDLTIQNSDLTLLSDNSSAIYTDDDDGDAPYPKTLITDSKIAAKSEDYDAIHAYYGLTIKNSEITAEGARRGIYMSAEPCLIEDSIVTAQGPEDGIDVHGCELTIRGEKTVVTAKGEESGFFGPGATLRVENGVKSVTGDSKTDFAMGFENGIELGSQIAIKEPAGGQIHPTENIVMEADGKTEAMHVVIGRTNCFVSFDANGGSGTMERASVAEGAEYTLPACTFKAPAGMTFGKWDAGKPGDKIKVTDDMTVKAVWNPFKDVPQSEYYFDPVLWALNHDPQITDGMTETTFVPDGTCTRGQVVTFLWRAMGCHEPTKSDNPFKDVTASDYFYKAVLWAVEKGITDGTSETTFSPNDPCTRAHVVTFLWRAENKPDAGNNNPFKDVLQSEYYFKPVLWAVAQKITDGTTETTFSPDAPCTRGQIVTFLYRDMK